MPIPGLPENFLPSLRTLAAPAGPSQAIGGTAVSGINAPVNFGDPGANAYFSALGQFAQPRQFAFAGLRTSTQPAPLAQQLFGGAGGNVSLLIIGGVAIAAVLLLRR